MALLSEDYVAGDAKMREIKCLQLSICSSWLSSTVTVQSMYFKTMESRVRPERVFTLVTAFFFGCLHSGADQGCVLSTVSGAWEHGSGNWN